MSLVIATSTYGIFHDMNRPGISALILAGGLARRMGGADKGLIELAGRPMVAWILERLHPQTDEVIINANRNQQDYAAYGCAVVGDEVEGFAGPLAGMAAGLAATRNQWIATVPCDSPLVPDDLIARLWQALENESAELSVAEVEGRMQPVFALLPVDLLSDLREYLTSGGRKIDAWFSSHRFALADFSDTPRAFVNVNTPEEVEEVERWLAVIS